MSVYNIEENNPLYKILYIVLSFVKIIAELYKRYIEPYFISNDKINIKSSYNQNNIKKS
jgi:hypothetical protein